MNYKTLATPETVSRTFEGLRARNIEPILVETRVEALEMIKSLIPAGASVTNGSSVTLDEIGYLEYLKSSQHPWNNLQAAIISEEDPVKRTKLRRAVVAEYYVGSVHALTEAGELVIASGTGSQLPSIAYDAQNVIFVVGAQKIVPTLDEAMKRLEEHVFPLEDEKMKARSGKGTVIGKVLIFKYEYAPSGRKVRLLLVHEPLGY
jgi:L-lactate utilization protein LutC